MKIKCPTCGRIIGDTQSTLDAHINCKRCGEQEIHIRIASFNDYITGHKATEETHDESK